MARSYHIDVAALAADADHKWVDNLLTKWEIDGIESARQGVARRISAGGIYHIALTRQLTRDLGLGAGLSVSLASRLLREGQIQVSPNLFLSVDSDRFRAEIDARLADAVDSFVPARRGRPPTRPARD
jgi:hypothetical protein